jgi:two-component system CheB/CheR fusion protein
MATSRPNTATPGSPRARVDRRARPKESGAAVAIVGIGASAGGLEACQKFVAALPQTPGIAYILIQHLDPSHESMMVDLLSGHTRVPMHQAADGMKIVGGHFYTIPPGVYLAVADDTLHLTQPGARHGARMPFDHLLHSLATAAGPRAIGVVLSGTGSDGTLGLQAIKAHGGYVIAQDPADAGFDGMPRSAIASGAVDLVVPAARIPAALVTRMQTLAAHVDRPAAAPSVPTATRLPEIIALLSARTGNDFSQYKQGTLLRRVERRMALAPQGKGDFDAYAALLRDSPEEQAALAKDLLIHVTSFFRDPKAFERLADEVLPDMLRRQDGDKPLRVWVAGCSTGEEAYSLAILFHEAAAAAGRALRLQIFASDSDPDSIATAREGLYPATIAAAMSPERLAARFTKETGGYRVAPEIRASVVFTVQDLLTDPPFSRIDLIACRNVLIYLRPDAQAKVIALFHFALRNGGVLFLGNAETVVGDDARFREISKSERIYRHVGSSRPGDLSFVLGEGTRIPARPGAPQTRTRQTALADLVQRTLLQEYAPPAVLVNQRHDLLYGAGPIDRHLRVAPGSPSSNLLSMVRHPVQARLRAALQQAALGRSRVVLPGGRAATGDEDMPFDIAVEPVQCDGEDLLLVCFIDQPAPPREAAAAAGPERARVTEIERELEATRTELQSAIRDLERSGEEQKAINEEALSVNEEFQSTNEELLTSKEELQSLNEELTALNAQLQESLDRKRVAADDLQNVLNSTDVATIFLDRQLNIRLFTPATRALFSIIGTDVGRPLQDLNSLAFDESLLADARAVLARGNPVESEIETHAGQWFMRRITAYRTADGEIEGVVITFVDATERKKSAGVLQTAARVVETASLAKSRFIAAASHDLRQPLQTMSLLQGLLAKAVAGTKAESLANRLADSLGAMSGMINTLLDLNQIEAGTLAVNAVDFPVNNLLDHLRDEFSYVARAKGLELRMVPCALTVHSDPQLLGQMMRNLLGNAVKYTRKGKLLLGCRRRGTALLIEIWDTGIGVPTEQLDAIFDEYHQLGNPARERSLGLGLGLSIVRQLGELLGHRVAVRSRMGHGSVFSIEVQVPTTAPGSGPAEKLPSAHTPAHKGATPRACVFVIEDDPDLRDLLAEMIRDDGFAVESVSDGGAALKLVASGKARPDIVLCDYNLPNGMDGLQTIERLRQALRNRLPAIVLTGDTSTQTLLAISGKDCVHMHKPAKMNDLLAALHNLVQSRPLPGLVAGPRPGSARGAAPASARPTVYVVDDDRMVRDAIRAELDGSGAVIADFASAEAFLAGYCPDAEACLLLDVYLPAMSGLELVRQLRAAGDALPVVMVTGKGDVSIAVQAMKSGALDFIEKPVSAAQLHAAIARALQVARDTGKLRVMRDNAAEHIAGLTPRQREVMDLVLAGHPSKNIAADLRISQRTVENHRAAIMKRTETRSLPELARLAVAAADRDAAGSHPPPNDPPGDKPA